MRVILFVWTILISLSVSGQGARVRFVPVDSISVLRPGQKVKLDFKTKDRYVGHYQAIYPSLRGARPTPDYVHWYGDTISLTIDGQKIEFGERKGKTLDWYLFGVECLISTTQSQGLVSVIPHSTIQDIKGDSILFRLTIATHKQNSNREWTEISSRTSDIWIKSKELDGVLIQDE